MRIFQDLQGWPVPAPWSDVVREVGNCAIELLMPLAISRGWGGEWWLLWCWHGIRATGQEGNKAAMQQATWQQTTRQQGNKATAQETGQQGTEVTGQVTEQHNNDVLFHHHLVKHSGQASPHDLLPRCLSWRHCVTGTSSLSGRWPSFGNCSPTHAMALATHQSKTLGLGFPCEGYRVIGARVPMALWTEAEAE